MSWFWPDSRMTGALRRGVVVGTGAWLVVQAARVATGPPAGMLAGAGSWLGCVALCFAFDGLWYRGRQRQLARFRARRGLWDLPDDELARQCDRRAVVSLGRSLLVSFPLASALMLLADTLDFDVDGWWALPLASLAVAALWYPLDRGYWRVRGPVALGRRDP